MPAARRLALALLLALLVLAGCGGGHTTTVRLTAPPQPAAGQSAMGSVAPPGWGSIHAPAPNGFRLTPTREMFDTVTLGSVHGAPCCLAGYVDGHWQTFAPLVAAYPHAIVKSIAVFFGDSAACGDFEPGDMTPSQVVAWFHFEQDIAHVFKPCIYSSWWEFVNQIIPALNAAHIPRSSYWAWDADYVYVSRIDTGFDATQWTNQAFGLNLDESTATLAFLGIKPPPPPPPPKQICFGKHPQNTPGCRFVQREVAAWRKHAAGDLANAARVTKHWS